MLDTNSLEDLIKSQISNAVDQQVNLLINNDELLGQIEANVTDHIRNRITAKFSNISNIPELTDTIRTSVSDLLNQGNIPGLGDYVDPLVLQRSIDDSIQQLVIDTIDNLITDRAWLEKIEGLVNREMVHKINDQLRHLDLDRSMPALIDNSIEKYMASTNRIGLRDRSTSTEITLMDGVVVIENDLVSKNLLVDESAEIKKSLIVNDLAVKGSINTDNKSWDELKNKISSECLQQIDEKWRASLVQQVLEIAKTQGIEFETITTGGRPVIDGISLGAMITHSYLTRVGDLENLVVQGPSRLAQTLTVLNRRVGVNTQDPETALSVWDEEVSVIIGKHSQNTAFVGTSKLQTLSIGINRQSQIEISTDGITTIKQLRLGRNRINYGPEVPNYSGTKGDIVFNSDPKPDQPFAWVCLGAFRWHALRSV